MRCEVGRVDGAAIEWCYDGNYGITGELNFVDGVDLYGSRTE